MQKNRQECSLLVGFLFNRKVFKLMRDLIQLAYSLLLPYLFQLSILMVLSILSFVLSPKVVP